MNKTDEPLTETSILAPLMPSSPSRKSNDGSTIIKPAPLSPHSRPSRGTATKKKEVRKPERVLTGYLPADAGTQSVFDLIVYDVPSTFSVEDLMQQFKLWGNIISIKRTFQRKYQTIRLKIELNSLYTSFYHRGDWMAPDRKSVV